MEQLLSPEPQPAVVRSAFNGPVFFLALAACGAAVALDAAAIVQPLLHMDDFQILAKSWTWQTTCTHLWLPQNEHLMPLGRLSTWVWVNTAGRLSWLPLLAALHGPAALVLGMGLLYLFVRRELGQPLYGLLAMTLFGVTAVYQQAVYWFAASFSILALDMLLLGLLAAQRWRQTGSRRQLVLSAFWCLLAPGWFASGILAGPLCFLYLLPRDRDKETRRQGDKETKEGWIRQLVCAAVPLLGTAIFAAVLFGWLRPVVEHIRRLEHYDGKTAEQAFHPSIGACYSACSVVDNLLPGLVGVWGMECPVGMVLVVWPILIAAAVWWIWLAPRRRLCWLGLAMIGLSYWLVYSARAEWGYTGMNAPHWGRYHMLPQLGLTLFLCAGLPRWFLGTADSRLSGRQIAAVVLLIGGCFLVHLPRGIAGQWGSSPGERSGNLWADLEAGWVGRQVWMDDQQTALREIEAMDARCRRHHISRETARDALPWKEIPLCYRRENGWEFLWGSPQPRAMPVQEARGLLLEDGDSTRRSHIIHESFHSGGGGCYANHRR